MPEQFFNIRPNELFAIALSCTVCIILVISALVIHIRQRRKVSSQDIPIFPAKLFYGSILLSLCAIAMMGYTAAQFRNTLEYTLREQLKIMSLNAEIMRLDEVLTMSALMAASTGDPKWEQRYMSHLQLLESTIKEATDFAPDAYLAAGAKETDAANAGLVALEQEAFHLVKEGKKEKALAILEGDNYSKMKSIYAKGMKQFTGFLESNSHRTIDNITRQQEYVLLTLPPGIILVLLSWFFSMRSIKRWRTESEITHARLGRTNLKMEAVARDLEESFAKAEAANKAKSDFLSNMSHELRTPMNGVLGMASLLADTPLNDEQKEFVTTINSSGENLLMLLNDILDFSKIEAGALVLEHIAFNLTDALHKTTTLLRPQAEKKGVDLSLDCETDVPHNIWGDSGRIRQIIMNLLGNAIKFTDRGHVRLSVRLQEADDGDRLHITIEDTGMGIPADKLGTIFEKFTQADSTVTRKYGGTGLGLTITKQLVGLMGGEIGVESAEGKGSSFWFTIPCKPAKASDEVVTIEQLRCITHSVIDKMPIGNARALLVEDYHVNKIFAEKLLRKFGFQHIDTAEDGLEAILKYDDNTYDIIFMDCQMPRMDGYITTQEIRARESSNLNYTPVVAMTANAMMGDREKCLKAGMDDYLSKPLRAEYLKKILQTWFVLDEGQSAISALKSSAPALKETEEAPVDMEQLRMFTDGDPAEEKALTTLFLDQAQEMIDILQQSTGADKRDIWKSTAHRFKGSSGNLGAMKLHHLCKRAEAHFEDSNAKKLEMLIAVKAETKRVAAYLDM